MERAAIAGRRRLLVASGLVLAVGGCVEARDHACANDEQCGAPGSGAVCEPTRSCSLPDPSCASGRRYVERASPALRGLCVPGPADAAPPSPDAASPDAVSGSSWVGAHCAPPGAGLGSDLDSPPPDFTWHTDPGATVTLEEGALLLAPPPLGLTAGYAAIASPGFSLLDRRIFVRVSKMVNGGEQAAYAALAVGVDGTRTIALVFQRGTLATRLVDGSTVNLLDVRRDHDPVADVWWQVRESGGVVQLETPAEGTIWAPLASAATPAFASGAVTLQLVAGTTAVPTSDPGLLALELLGDCAD